MSSGLQPQLTPLLPQGFVLLPKSECDVREVEFARCLRLRQTSLEPVAFRLPRVRVRLDPRSLTPSPHPSPSGALGPGWPCHETAPLAALWGTCTPSYAEIQKPQTGVPGLAILPPPTNGCHCALGSGQCLRAAPSSLHCRKSSSRMTCSQTQPSPGSRYSVPRPGWKALTGSPGFSACSPLA